MIAQFVSALILGIVGGIIPGPVLTATFTEVLERGFVKSLRVVFFAMLIESCVALISLASLSVLALAQSFFYAISFLGAAILLWIAWQLWAVTSLEPSQKVNFKLRKIAAMILPNGILWLFWLTVCIPKALTVAQKVRYGQLLFVLTVEVGWLLSTIGLAFLFSRFRVVLSNPRLTPILFKFFAIAFIYFALGMLYSSGVYFLRV